MPVKEGATLHGSEESGADGKWSPLVGEPADAQRGGYGIARRGRGVRRKGRLEEGTRGAPETFREDIGSEGPVTHRAKLAVARANEGEGVLIGEPTRTKAGRPGMCRVRGTGGKREPKLVHRAFLKNGAIEVGGR